MRGCALYGVRRRRQSIRNSQRLQQRSGRRGGRAETSNHARHDVGIFPPLQAAWWGAGAEALQAAAKRHDGAGQFWPVRMPRPDAVLRGGRAGQASGIGVNRPGCCPQISLSRVAVRALGVSFRLSPPVGGPFRGHWLRWQSSLGRAPVPRHQSGLSWRPTPVSAAQVCCAPATAAH